MLNGNIIRALALHSSYQSRISGQLRRLGGSYDWNRVAFTMDEVCVHVLFAMDPLVNPRISLFRTCQRLWQRHFAAFMRMVSFTVLTVLSTGVLS